MAGNVPEFVCLVLVVLCFGIFAINYTILGFV